MPGYRGVVPAEQPRPELFCSQCSLLLRDALLTGEGDHMCRSCYEEKKQSGVWWCLDLSYDPDHALDEEVQLLQVNCTNSARGCQWQGPLKDLEEHCSECGKWPNMKRCSIEGSGELIPSSEMRYHNKKACRYRMVSCTHCNKKTPANMLQDHISHCEYQPQPCSNEGCGNLIAQSEKMHHEKYTCAFRLMTCHVCKESVVVNQLKAHRSLCHARCAPATFPQARSLGTSPVRETPIVKPGQVSHFYSTGGGTTRDTRFYKMNASPLERVWDLEEPLSVGLGHHCCNVEQVRKRRLEDDHGDLCVSQLSTLLLKLRAFVKKIQLHLQKIIALLQIDGKKPAGLQGMDMSEIWFVCQAIVRVKSHLEGHLMALEEQLFQVNTATCESPSCPQNCGGVLWRKKPKFSNMSYKGSVYGGSSWAHDKKNFEERIQRLEQEVETNRHIIERQGEKLENLEKENKLLKSHIISELPGTPSVVEDQGHGQLVITKKVYKQCIDKIYDWIDVKCMLPQLIKHNLIITQDDIHQVMNGSPDQKKAYLYCKLCGCKDGFQLLYHCLRQSQDNSLGHKDAADILEKTAQQNGILRSLASH